MDAKLRNMILESVARAERLLEQVKGTKSNVILMTTAELSQLLNEHVFVCGFAMGASPLESEND